MGHDSFPIKVELRNYKGTINLIPAVIATERPSSIHSVVFSALSLSKSALVAHDTDKIWNNNFDENILASDCSMRLFDRSVRQRRKKNRSRDKNSRTGRNVGLD